MKISKLIPIDRLKASVIGGGPTTLQQFEKRQCGETLGRAFELISKAMLNACSNDVGYRTVEYVCNTQGEAINLLRSVEMVIRKLGLKHFRISRSPLKCVSVTYEPFWKEGELIHALLTHEEECLKQPPLPPEIDMEIK